jgi:TetR/AcrR family transcriptional regulator
MNRNTDLNDHTTKHMILAAGIDLFAEKGYAGTSVREIVERAGVTKPVLYYYFNNKAGLFRAILDWTAEFQESVLARVFERSGSLLERLVDLYRLIYKSVMENQKLYRMIHNLFFGPPQGAPPYDIEHFRRRMVDTIKNLYLKALTDQEVEEADAEDVAIMIMGLTDICFHLDLLHPESADPNRPERLLCLAFRGLHRKHDED